jgi:hypothetical protein
VSLTLTFAGKARFLSHLEYGNSRLIVAVECAFPGLPPIDAMLDTAAQWSMLPPTIAHELGCSTEPDPDVPRYSTRKGLLPGRIEPITFTLPAEVGAHVRLRAPFYICEEWEGPLMLGWTGCLEYLPFALDPRQHEEFFYFGSADGTD